MRPRRIRPLSDARIIILKRVRRRIRNIHGIAIDLDYITDRIRDGLLQDDCQAVFVAYKEGRAALKEFKRLIDQKPGDDTDAETEFLETYENYADFMTNAKLEIEDLCGMVEE